MQIDYKFWYITKNNGVITECGVRFFEGAESTELETDENWVKQPVTRYRRTKRLVKLDLPAQAGVQFRVENNGNESAVYTQDDFGIISDEDDLRLFMNKEIAKDTGRTPNTAQATVVLSELKKQKIR